MKTVRALQQIGRPSRQELARELATSIAFQNRGKSEKAQAHGGKLVQALLRLRLIKAGPI